MKEVVLSHMGSRHWGGKGTVNNQRVFLKYNLVPPSHSSYRIFCKEIFNSCPLTYLTLLRQLGPPLRYINSFINDNLVWLAKYRGSDKRFMTWKKKGFTEKVALVEDLINPLFEYILHEPNPICGSDVMWLLAKSAKGTKQSCKLLFSSWKFHKGLK